MTALEAALAFAEAKHTDNFRHLFRHRNPGEPIMDTALRILAAQVRADAARKLDEADLAKRISDRIGLLAAEQYRILMNQYSIEDIVKEELMKVKQTS